MKILIISRWFSPEKNPRAFRTTELVNELKKRKYDLEIIVPDNADVVECDNVEFHTIRGFKKNDTVKKNISSYKANIYSHIKNFFLFFFGEGPSDILYANKLVKKIRADIDIDKIDVVISIGLPFYVHLATVLGIKEANNKCIRIADCGDPFFYNPYRKCAFYLKNLEKYVFQKFDYITIPVESAKVAYKNCDVDEKIRIIPQGFSLININADMYQKHEVPTFCYAGIFYKNIRDPEYFFKYLVDLKIDYKFVVYAIEDEFTKGILDKYSTLLKDKLEVHSAIPREELIKIMSTMDFVINFNNNNSVQRPSKLIDYAMSKRPILSFNEQSFSVDVIEEFMKGNYTNQEEIDLSKYDICTVVNEFESLFMNK